MGPRIDPDKAGSAIEPGPNRLAGALLILDVFEEAPRRRVLLLGTGRNYLDCRNRRPAAAFGGDESSALACSPSI